MATQYLADRRGLFLYHGIVYTHSCRILAKKIPHAYTEEPLYAPHVTILCNFTLEIIVTIFFFKKPCARLTLIKILTVLDLWKANNSVLIN